MEQCKIECSSELEKCKKERNDSNDELEQCKNEQKGSNDELEKCKKERGELEEKVDSVTKELQVRVILLLHLEYFFEPFNRKRGQQLQLLAQ